MFFVVFERVSGSGEPSSMVFALSLPCVQTSSRAWRRGCGAPPGPPAGDPGDGPDPSGPGGGKVGALGPGEECSGCTEECQCAISCADPGLPRRPRDPG